MSHSGTGSTLKDSQTRRPTSSAPSSSPEIAVPAPLALIIDSDAFVLLAAAGALQDVIAALGLDPSACRRFHALPWMVKRGRFDQLSEKTLGGEASRLAMSRVLEQCEQIAPLEERAGEPEVFQLLSGVIDPGELQAVAYLVHAPDTKFLSNDQRWMRAVCADQSFIAIRERIAGRVICLESVLSLLLASWGVERLAKELSPLKQHRHLKVYLSDGPATKDEHLRAAIASYFRARQAELGGDFLFEP